MSKLKFRVAYLTHTYVDCSDRPRLAYRIVNADTSDEAREIVRAMEKVGNRYIGMIHQAEVYAAAAGAQP
jgi:hypothetical protein